MKDGSDHNKMLKEDARSVEATVSVPLAGHGQM